MIVTSQPSEAVVGVTDVMVGDRRVGGRRKAEHEHGHRHADRSHAPAHVPFEKGHGSVLTFRSTSSRLWLHRQAFPGISSLPI